MADRHFNQTPKRKAKFITPPNGLKGKVGSGGLAEEVLDRTQQLLEKHTENFEPLADIYLNKLKESIAIAKETGPEDDEEMALTLMIDPAMQLKSNGGMFKFPFVTEIADMLVHFFEVVERPDKECIEIAEAFHTTLRLIVRSGIRQSSTSEAKALKQALRDACQRYFDLYPNRLQMIGFD